MLKELNIAEEKLKEWIETIKHACTRRGRGEPGRKAEVTRVIRSDDLASTGRTL